MTVREILEAYLKANGYDGLYSWQECACVIGDLAPCGHMQMDCEPGYLCPCDCGDHDWHIGPKKKEQPMTETTQHGDSTFAASIKCGESEGEAMNEIKRYEIHLRHDDRQIFVEKLKGLLTPFPEVFDAAVQAERKRCREEEVEPLVIELLYAKKALDFGELASDRKRAEQKDIVTVLAAVKQVRKEKP